MEAIALGGPSHKNDQHFKSDTGLDELGNCSSPAFNNISVKYEGSGKKAKIMVI